MSSWNLNKQAEKLWFILAFAKPECWAAKLLLAYSAVCLDISVMWKKTKKHIFFAYVLESQESRIQDLCF